MTSDRFGFDAPKDRPIEESIRWAGATGFRYINFQVDVAPNHIASFDAPRVQAIRSLCETHGVLLGIHPSSAVNSAEYTPIMSQAVDEYLLANLGLAARLGCDHMIAHGGYHFGDITRRRAAAVERLQRLVEWAGRTNVTLFFENHNREPDRAEVHYIPHTVEELHWFLDVVRAPHCRWAFNVAHGHLVPEGWQGFLDEFGVERIGQVRVNDNRGDYEVHLVPGEGTIDFPALFAQLKQKGYAGWFCLGFGDEADKIRIRDWFNTLL